jgi:hypothetical protein
MAEQRDYLGRFSPGNRGGPDRPRRQTEADYLRVTMQACSLETWRAIVEAAVEAARGGDHQARQWLARYLIGEPQGVAPAPTAVIADDLAGADKALDQAARQAARSAITEAQFPGWDDPEERLIREAREALRRTSNSQT